MKTIKSQLQHFDTKVFIWVQNYWQQERFFSAARLISKSGDGWLYPIIALLAYYVDPSQGILFFKSSLIAYTCQLPLYVLLKRQFKRSRPQDYIQSFKARINPSDQFSFPSGHTAAAFVMASQIIIFYPLLALPFLTWALLVGASRVLLGVHFPGDILAGALLGGLCSVFINQLFDF